MKLLGARIVTPDGVRTGCSVRIAGDQIVGIDEIDERATATDEVAVLAGGWLFPGMVDLHCHGGDGGDFASADPAQLTTAACFHARHGTTTMLASLVSNTVPRLCHQLAALADHIELGATPVVGAHLEGPFLSGLRCGAQNPLYLAQPDVADFWRLHEAARGCLRMITIAPELPDALGLIEVAASAGVVVALGHTDASYAQTLAGLRAGASVATHLFNGMRPVHHRDPGPVFAALESDAVCEVIADGFHLHPAAIRLIADRAPDRIALITDAIAAAGIGDGDYELGDQRITVAGGQARLTDGDSLAGSTLTAQSAIRYALGTAQLSPAVTAAAIGANPARALGLGATVGAIQVGHRADLVHLDDGLNLRAVLAGGTWLEPT